MERFFFFFLFSLAPFLIPLPPPLWAMRISSVTCIFFLSEMINFFHLDNRLKVWNVSRVKNFWLMFNMLLWHRSPIKTSNLSQMRKLNFLIKYLKFRPLTVEHFKNKLWSYIWTLCKKNDLEVKTCQSEALVVRCSS